MKLVRAHHVLACAWASVLQRSKADLIWTAYAGRAPRAAEENGRLTAERQDARSIRRPLEPPAKIGVWVPQAAEVVLQSGLTGLKGRRGAVVGGDGAGCSAQTDTPAGRTEIQPRRSADRAAPE